MIEEENHVFNNNNKNTSSNITQTLLTLNRAYQEVIQEKINNLNLLLKLNHQQQAKAYEKITSNSYASSSTTPKFNLATIQKDSNNGNETEISKIKDNYFKDRFNSFPNDNKDALYRNKLVYYDYIPLIKAEWTVENRKKLKKAIFEDAVRIIKAPLTNKISFLEEKLLNFTLKNTHKDRQDITNVQKMLKEASNQMKKLEILEESQVFAQVDVEKIDWMKISKIDFKGSWSSKECRLMWVNVCHPSISQEKWTANENSQLIELARNYQEKNWERISIELNTNRTAYLCMKRYHEKTADKYVRRDWTDQESNELCEYAESTRIGLTVPFNYLCYLNGTRDRTSVYNWYLKINPQLNHGKWSPSEKQAFEEAIEFYKFNLNWQEISEYVGTRTNLQCKERYELKHQHPDKYVNWTIEDDKMLLDAIDQYGQHWVKIAASVLPNRTDHSCLFRYSRLMQWRKQLEWYEEQPDEIKEFMSFLFKSRANSSNESQVDVFTRKGHLVPTAPKFGPGTRNLNNIINTIYEKKNLVYEFINKKRDGQLSLVLLNKIGIYTPVVNGWVTRFKRLHNISSTSSSSPQVSKVGKKRGRAPIRPENRATVTVKKQRLKSAKKREAIKDTLNKLALNNANNQLQTDQQPLNLINENLIGKSKALKRKYNLISKQNRKLKKEKGVVHEDVIEQVAHAVYEPSTDIESTVNNDYQNHRYKLAKKYRRTEAIKDSIENNDPNKQTKDNNLDNLKKQKSLKINQILSCVEEENRIIFTMPSNNDSNNKPIRIKRPYNKVKSNKLDANGEESKNNKKTKKAKEPKTKEVIKEKPPKKSKPTKTSTNQASQLNCEENVPSSNNKNSTPKKPRIYSEYKSTVIKYKVECSLSVEFKDIEDGQKIPCLGEEYNEFKYMYSLKKSNDFSFFKKFTLIKFNQKIIAIKPLNGSISNDWLTDERLDAISKALNQVFPSVK